MKRHPNDVPFTRQRAKPKRSALRRLIHLFLLLCCCLAAVVWAIDLTKNGSPPAVDQQSTVGFPAQSTADTGFITNARSETDEQSANPGHADDTAWCLILVNKWNPLPDDYAVELTQLTNGHAVDKRIYPALQEMFDDARHSGVYPVVVSGYRTAEKQKHLMDEKIDYYLSEGYSAEKAAARAEAKIALPGTSEHQLGLAVDINADGVHSKGEEVYAWLNKNSYKYGFIQRYAADKTQITGIVDEPWHYRYVGIEAAYEIYMQNLCLEEYLYQIQQRGH